jgi:hypothetical protein
LLAALFVSKSYYASVNAQHNEAKKMHAVSGWNRDKKTRTQQRTTAPMHSNRSIHFH